MRMLAMLKNDIRFQFRNGFYYFYLFLATLYILGLRSIPDPSVKTVIGILLIFSEVSILGFLFIGANLLLEKDQNTLSGLFITPINPIEYLITRLISLTVAPILICLVIALAVFGFDLNYAYLILGISSSAIVFNLMGFPLACRARSFNEYVAIAGIIIMGLIVLPLVDYFKLLESLWFDLLPTSASLLLIESAFQSHAPESIGYALLNLAIWILLSGFWTYIWFVKYVVLKIGEDQ